MDLVLDRIGKLALFAAMTNREEEEKLKEKVQTEMPGYRLGVTFLSGSKTDVMKSASKAVVNCAVQNDVIRKSASSIHAVTHAMLEAIESIVGYIPSDTSLKLKVAIVSDNSWIAVAIYGDSAIHPITNHERAGLGIMHL